MNLRKLQSSIRHKENLIEDKEHEIELISESGMEELKQIEFSDIKERLLSLVSEEFFYCSIENYGWCNNYVTYAIYPLKVAVFKNGFARIYDHIRFNNYKNRLLKRYKNNNDVIEAYTYFEKLRKQQLT